MTKTKTIDELVREARSRIGAMRIAPPGGIESSKAAADEIERAIDALQKSLPVEDTTHFYETIAKVEERFRPVYDREAVNTAKTEAQMSKDQVSTGWWIVLSRAGVAIRTGSEQPDYREGDTVVFTMQRLHRQAELGK